MPCEVACSDEFVAWFGKLPDATQDAVARVVGLLEQLGTELPFPYSSGINGSKHSHMRELRIKHKGDQYRVLYAFDPRREAYLIIGGNKTGDDRWYETYVPLADKIFDQYLKEIGHG